MKTVYLLLIFLLSASVHLYSQDLTADFSADQQEGCDELAVNFTDRSSFPDEVSYFWDFGNGQTSTLQNPAAVYTQAGSYTVTLTITDGTNSDTETKANFIVVHNGPQAFFSTSGDTIGCAPYLVSFSDNSIPGDVPIETRLFDFGDGNYSDDENPSHSYIVQNHYSPVLTITDENGCSDYYRLDNRFKVFNPQADFSVSLDNSCNGTAVAQFINLSEASAPVNYDWAFGDGQGASEANPVHAYNLPGSFDVSLNIIDSAGCSNSLSKIDFVDVQQTHAEFELLNDTVCPGEQVRFINRSVMADEYYWDFADGSSSSAVNPSHIFLTSGDYSVVLSVISNEGCTDSFAINVHVQNVIADFQQETDFACSLPIELSLKNASQNSDSLFWYLDDELVSQAENPSFNYTKQGIFDITLIVKSRYGCSDTLVRESAVEIALPRAYFTPNDLMNPSGLKGCVPVDVNLQYAGSYNTEKDSVTSYYWNFGDGTSSMLKNPSHLYPNVGRYMISLTVTTARGCTSTYYAQAQTGTPQYPDFDKLNPDTVCASEEVAFKDLSVDQDKINSWLWRFGDKKQSPYQNPTHFYTDTGYMDVQLSVYHNGCRTDTIKENFIYIKGPYANMHIEKRCEAPFWIQFQAKIMAAESYYWDFGDGSATVYNEDNVIHNYSGTGDYSARLVLENISSGCEYEVETNLKIRNLITEFSVPSEPVCVGENISFSGENSQDISFFMYDDLKGLYLWDFGDGSPKVMTEEPITHRYTAGGIYQVSLTVQDINGCQRTLSKSVRVFQPRADFEIVSQTGCMPLGVKFEHTGVSDTLISEYLWDFGDGNTSDESHPKHTYTEFGIYTVSLQVVDRIGCSAVLSRDSTVASFQPVSNFSAQGTQICKGDETQFTAISAPDIVGWEWDFGDGMGSDDKNPTHVYADSGRYDVSLRVTDVRGCSDIRERPRFVAVQNYPSAAFTAAQQDFVCYPAEVDLHSSEDRQFVSEWFWNFGDGQVSVLPNPFHTYTQPGSYDVSLTLSSSFGCESSHTESDFIEVDGPTAEICAPDTACRYAPVLFTFENASGVYDWEWVFNDGSAELSDSATHTFGTFGPQINYLQLRADENGTCDKIIIDTLYIRYFEATIETEDGFSACMPYRAEFQNLGESVVQAQWDFGTGNGSTDLMPEHLYSEAGSYNPQVIAEDTYGCLDTAYAEITVWPLPEISVSTDTTICAGSSATLFAGGALEYEWFPFIDLSDNSGDQTEAFPPHSRMYFVRGTDENGCTNQLSTYITVIPVPEICISDTSIVIGDTVSIGYASDAFASYAWYSSSYIENPEWGVISVSPQETTMYEWVALDTAGCFEYTKKIQVYVEKLYTLDMPDAFSPNDDGINDVLYVKGFGIDELISFEIFNRFGESIFFSSDINHGWNGKQAAKSEPIETYKYFVAARMLNGEIKQMSGSVKLLK